MATIKLKKPAASMRPDPTRPDPPRAPLRGAGAGVKPRPTLAEAQAQRAERETRYRERYEDQLRQRYGDRPPPREQAGRVEGSPFDRPRAAPRRNAAPAEGDLQRRVDAARRERELQAQSPPAPAAPRSRQPAARNERRPPAPNRSRRDRDDDHNEPPEHAEGSMRLSKRMSELGMASRREADEWIAKGWVRVDGQIVAELGSRVVPGQHITIDAKARFQQAQRVTVLINKPVGYVSGQAEDGYEPALVLVTPQNQWREDRSGTRFLREHLRSLVPAGRLDIDSVGLLVLTQDGRVAKQLIGEDSGVEKEYLVRVEVGEAGDGARLPDSGLALLRHGLELDGEALQPARVEWVNDDQLRFVLTEGKKRQIRRMCEAVGLKVTGLKRVRIGQVMLGDLPAGQWRYLRADETFV